MTGDCLSCKHAKGCFCSARTSPPNCTARSGPDTRSARRSPPFCPFVGRVPAARGVDGGALTGEDAGLFEVLHWMHTEHLRHVASKGAAS